MQHALRSKLEAVENRYYRLLLVVGSQADAVVEDLVTSCGGNVINLSLAMSERLLEVKQADRAWTARTVVGELLADGQASLLGVTRLCLLFEPSLELDPLRVLYGASRNRTIVAAWPGRFEGEELTYAEKGHPEWRSYPFPEAEVHVLGE